ncbi:hypothetical protein [Clostridium ihumii]|uniref:hypothetical protein n=1 Tax=Clostridium ihumii TaxID=1470356 RepID=UPI000ADEDB8E|nr:hypothetical protein [Clostridium ihumii]
MHDKSFNQAVEELRVVYIEIIKILEIIEYKKLLDLNEYNEIVDELALQRMFNNYI